MQGLLTPSAAAPTAVPNPKVPSLSSLRTELLGDTGGLDPRRCALAVVKYPEGRTLAADEADAGSVVVECGNSRSGSRGGGDEAGAGDRDTMTVSLTFHEGGYDPAWLIPYTIQVRVSFHPSVYWRAGGLVPPL